MTEKMNETCLVCGRDAAELHYIPRLETNAAGAWFVLCSRAYGGCGATGGVGKTPEEAIAAWNRGVVKQ